MNETTPRSDGLVNYIISQMTSRWILDPARTISQPPLHSPLQLP